MRGTQGRRASGGASHGARTTLFASLFASLIASLIAGSAAGAGQAAVLDIAPDGRVTTIDRPSLFLSPDPSAAQPIVLRRAPSRSDAPSAGPVKNAIAAASQSVQLDPDLVEAVAWRESRLRPDAVSPKGAVGVMQLMPATARSLGVQDGEMSSNVRGGAVYLRRMISYYDGDLIKALAAYNAGPGAVDRHGGLPPYRETRAYVDAVLERLAERVAPLQTAQTGRLRP